MNFRENLKTQFERFMKTSNDLYFDIHFDVDEVSDEIKSYLHYNEEDYEDRTEIYNKYGFKFRIIRNGDVYNIRRDRFNDEYVSEDCLIAIKSKLAEKVYYDACTNTVY